MLLDTWLICMVLCGVLAPCQTWAWANETNCGISSIADMCAVTGRNLGAEEQRTLESRLPGTTCSMLDVKAAAAAIGLDLIGANINLDGLLMTLRGPKIIHLRDPEHFAVVLTGSSEMVQLLEAGQLVVVPHSEVAKRYDGYALVLPEATMANGPRLQLKNFHCDFGVVGVGQRVTQVFRVANGGDEEMSIATQPQGCWSPATTIDQDILAPGQETQITASFTVPISGEMMLGVKLLSSDPAQPLTYLTIRGKVPHGLTVRPDKVYVGGYRGERPSRVVVVSGPEDMQLGQVRCQNGLFDISISRPTLSHDGARSWRIQVTAKETNRIGPIDDELEIETGHKERPLITVPISGEIRGDLMLSSRSLFLARMHDGKHEGELLLASRLGKPFCVKRVEADDRRVVVGAEQRTAGVWVLRASVDDTSEPGVVDAVITVMTDVPGEETLKIPVYAHVKEGDG